MKLKLGFILDPLETLQVAMDTSLLMISEANARGHNVSYCTIDDINILNGIAYGRWSRIDYRSGDVVTDSIRETVLCPLSEFDIIAVRKDPPFDQAYLGMTYILDYAKTTVINSPRGLREANEKLLVQRWPHITPPSFVSRNIDDLEKFINSSSGACVIKPINLSGGQKIFKVNPYDKNLQAILSAVTSNGTDYAVIQSFIPEVYSGDKRVFLVDGQPIGQMKRIPPSGDFRANIHLGAKPERCDLFDQDLEIIDTIKSLLAELELPIACIDIVGGYLTEINVTSPSGIPEINAVTGVRHETILVDYLERAAAEKLGSS